MERRKVIYNGTIKPFKGRVVEIVRETAKMYKYRIRATMFTTYERNSMHQWNIWNRGGYYEGMVLKRNTGYVDTLSDDMFTI